MLFHYVNIISTWKRVCPKRVWSNLNPLYTRMACSSLAEFTQWFWRLKDYNHEVRHRINVTPSCKTSSCIPCTIWTPVVLLWIKQSSYDNAKIAWLKNSLVYNFWCFSNMILKSTDHSHGNLSGKGQHVNWCYDTTVYTTILVHQGVHHFAWASNSLLEIPLQTAFPVTQWKKI